MCTTTPSPPHPPHQLPPPPPPPPPKKKKKKTPPHPRRNTTRSFCSATKHRTVNRTRFYGIATHLPRLHPSSCRRSHRTRGLRPEPASLSGLCCHKRRGKHWHCTGDQKPWSTAATAFHSLARAAGIQPTSCGTRDGFWVSRMAQSLGRRYANISIIIIYVSYEKTSSSHCVVVRWTVFVLQHGWGSFAPLSL